jgi:lipoprotein
MKKSPYIPFAFLCLLSAMSCIEEKLDPCPPQGGEVTVALRVEKFQARPPYRPSDFEQEFGKRIHSLDYLLYADGQLIG